MNSTSAANIESVAKLIEAIDWQMRFPGYVFNEKRFLGFLIIESGILTTRGFLDSILSGGCEGGGGSLTIIVRPHDQATKDLIFFAGNSEEVARARIHVMQSELDLFGSIVLASSAPSKWVAYEETAQDFAVLIVFDEKVWGLWSSEGSDMRDCVISEEQIAARLATDEWPGWEPDFLAEILRSYGRAGKG